MLSMLPYILVSLFAMCLSAWFANWKKKKEKMKYNVLGVMKENEKNLRKNQFEDFFIPSEFYVNSNESHSKSTSNFCSWQRARKSSYKQQFTRIATKHKYRECLRMENSTNSIFRMCVKLRVPDLLRQWKTRSICIKTMRKIIIQTIFPIFFVTLFCLYIIIHHQSGELANSLSLT